VTTIAQAVWKRRVPALLFGLMVGLLATGCKTYQEQNHVIKYWRQGALTNAVAEATKLADKNANNKDAIIWRLEQGAVLRGAGQYEASNKAFDQAQAKIDDYAQKAKVRLGQEAGAMLSNQANLDYEGRAYDGIMLNTYKALNYLQLGEIEKARPELIRAYQRQKDAVDDNKKRIEKAQKDAADSKDSAAMEKAENDPGFKAEMQNSYTNLDHLKPYSSYVNPFTVYLDGLYFMAQAADGSDLERAHKSLERVVGFAPDNEYVKQDLAADDDLINGKPLSPTTYVIFETGCAPERGQIRIDIPIVMTKVSWVGAAFPKLEYQGNYAPTLSVTVNGANLTTSPVASMDSVIGLDFKNELPIIITKTIASTVTKAVASYVANEAAGQQNDWLSALVRVSTAVYQIAVNIADTRTWTTLPKEFAVCRLPTPADRKIELQPANGGQKIPVTIADGTINIVYVRSITATGPLLVTQFKLK
jgi:uncharacterized protein